MVSGSTPQVSRKKRLAAETVRDSIEARIMRAVRGMVQLSFPWALAPEPGDARHLGPVKPGDWLEAFPSREALREQFRDSYARVRSRGLTAARGPGVR